MTREVPLTEGRTTTLKGAARLFGVSAKTFRDRFMPRIPSLDVSSPGSIRRRRRFSIEVLDQAVRDLGRIAP